MALLNPLASYRLTQGFGVTWVYAEPSMYYAARTSAAFHNYSGANYNTNVHPAWDEAAPYGTPLRACEAGTVVYAGWAPSEWEGGGYIIEVAIHGGMHYMFAHCSNFAVRTGAKVSKGQIIAYLGSSGNSTGAHVHWMVFSLDAYRRPMLYNPSLFLPGGLWQNDPRIRPIVAAQKVCPNGPGVNIRSQPRVASAYVYRTTSTTRSAAWPNGYLLCSAKFTGYTFGGQVVGDYYTVGGVRSNIWLKIWLNGGWRYIAKPLAHFV